MPAEKPSSGLDAPAPAHRNMLLQRGRDEIELYRDGRAVARELAWAKIYPQLCRAVAREIGLKELATLLLVSDHANVEDGRLVIELTTEEIGAQIGVDASTAKRYMRRLARAGFVSHQREKTASGQIVRGFWVVHSESGLARYGLNTALEPGVHSAPEAGSGLGGETAPEGENACNEPPVHSAPEGEPQQLSLDAAATVAALHPRAAVEKIPCSDQKGRSPTVAAGTGGPLAPPKQDVAAREIYNNSTGPEHAFAVQALNDYGVSAPMIEELIRDFGVEECLKQLLSIEHRNAKNKAAMLVTSIRERWSEPDEIKKLREQEEAEQQQREIERAEAEAEAERRARQAEAEALLNALPAEQRDAIRQEVVDELTSTDSSYSRLLLKNDAVLESLVRERVRKRLLPDSEQAA